METSSKGQKGTALNKLPATKQEQKTPALKEAKKQLQAQRPPERISTYSSWTAFTLTARAMICSIRKNEVKQSCSSAVRQ